MCVCWEIECANDDAEERWMVKVCEVKKEWVLNQLVTFDESSFFACSPNWSIWLVSIKRANGKVLCFYSSTGKGVYTYNWHGDIDIYTPSQSALTLTFTSWVTECKQRFVRSHFLFCFVFFLLLSLSRSFDKCIARLWQQQTTTTEQRKGKTSKIVRIAMKERTKKNY